MKIRTECRARPKYAASNCGQKEKSEEAGKNSTSMHLPGVLSAANSLCLGTPSMPM